MGVISDVFIASPDQLTEEILELGPVGRLSALEGKGLFPNDLRKLWGLISSTAIIWLRPVMSSITLGNYWDNRVISTGCRTDILGTRSNISEREKERS